MGHLDTLELLLDLGARPSASRKRRLSMSPDPISLAHDFAQIFVDWV
jgi:hypothetical protein